MRQSRDGLIFWSRELRLEGPCAPQDAALRLRAMLAAPRTPFGAFPAGRLDANGNLTLWRRTPTAFAGDVVEFRGAVRGAGAGAVIEGRLAFQWGTKVQFIGLLAFGAGVALIGLLQGTEDGGRLAQFGGMTFAFVALWLFASRSTRRQQIDFIEERLRVALAPPA